MFLFALILPVLAYAQCALCIDSNMKYCLKSSQCCSLYSNKPGCDNSNVCSTMFEIPYQVCPSNENVCGLSKRTLGKSEWFSKSSLHLHARNLPKDEVCVYEIDIQPQLGMMIELRTKDEVGAWA